jgi:hypothetical protein
VGTARKARLEKAVSELAREQTELKAHLQAVTVTDAHIAKMEAFCAKVWAWLESATFEDKERCLELVDIRAKLAVDDAQKVV